MLLFEHHLSLNLGSSSDNELNHSASTGHEQHDLLIYSEIVRAQRYNVKATLGLVSTEAEQTNNYGIKLVLFRLHHFQKRWRSAPTENGNVK